MKAKTMAELAKLAFDNDCPFNSDQLEAIGAEYIHLQLGNRYIWKFSDGSCGYYGKDLKFYLINETAK